MNVGRAKETVREVIRGLGGVYLCRSSTAVGFLCRVCGSLRCQEMCGSRRTLRSSDAMTRDLSLSFSVPLPLCRRVYVHLRLGEYFVPLYCLVMGAGGRGQRILQNVTMVR